MQPMVKPAHLFDREAEWSALARFGASASPDVRLGVVSGRRRQGKTYLLSALAERSGAFFFSANETTEPDALRQFGAALAEYGGAAAPYHFPDWQAALDSLFRTAPGGLVIIDEFPYLVKASPALPSLLQRALDQRVDTSARHPTRVILCGSAMSVMGGLLSGTAPLRGRASLELVVPPLSYRDAARFWGVTDPRLAVLLHAVVGGTPAYRREFTGGDAPTSLADFDDWVVRTVLSPESPLFREARYLLSEEGEIRDTAVYHSVLGAIAGGNMTRGGIANHMARKSTDIAHPLTVLEDCQLIDRAEDAFRRGRSRYLIAEPLIAFYEAVMRPAWTRLERRQAPRAWADARPRFLSQVVGPHFETLCRLYASDAGEDVFGSAVGEVAAGRVNDPRQRGGIEVDVVAFAPAVSGETRRVVSLGEAKWGETMGMRHLARLRRARDLLAIQGYDTRGAVLACYGGNGFDDQLATAARAGEARLVEVADLYA